MNRRHILRLLAAIGLTPALPAVAPAAAGGAAGAGAALYSRKLYAHAAFQARTRASLSAADLVARLRVTPAQAQAMMGELSTRGVLTPILSSASGAMRALSASPKTSPELGQMARKALDLAVRQGDDSPDQAVTDQNAQAEALSLATETDSTTDIAAAGEMPLAASDIPQSGPSGCEEV